MLRKEPDHRTITTLLLCPLHACSFSPQGMGTERSSSARLCSYPPTRAHQDALFTQASTVSSCAFCASTEYQQAITFLLGYLSLLNPPFLSTVAGISPSPPASDYWPHFSPLLSLGKGIRGGPTAPVERAHSDRARSGSSGPHGSS